MISLRPAALKECKPHEYVVRFVFGGACTVLAGLVAREYGAGVGGLFLAFPAIFPATTSLIEAHEKRRKKQAGMHGTQRGHLAAGADAAGSALGAIGLASFAAVVWLLLEQHNSAWVIASATAVWGAVSVAAWSLRRKAVHTMRQRLAQSRAMDVLVKRP